MSGFKKKVEELFNYMDIMIRHFAFLKWQRLKDYEDLSLQELNAIHIIGKKGPCIMREVAESMMLAVSTMTTIMDKLVAKELVIRKRSDADRRVVRVLLTGRGKELYQANLQAHLELTKAMLNTLNKDEQEIFIIFLRKISGNLGNGLSEKTTNYKASKS
ncbi:MAG: MarR family winged helix-turn-helix transcriptional regulator [bacterium]